MKIRKQTWTVTKKTVHHVLKRTASQLMLVSIFPKEMRQVLIREMLQISQKILKSHDPSTVLIE